MPAKVPAKTSNRTVHALAAAQEERRLVHAAHQRDPVGELLSLARVLAGSDDDSQADAGRIVYAVSVALTRGGPLRGRGGPLGWAVRYLESTPEGATLPSRAALIRQLEDCVKGYPELAKGLDLEPVSPEDWTTERDPEDIAEHALHVLLPHARAAGLRWHTHTAGDVDGLRRRIAMSIRKARERTPCTADRIVRAILVGWGLTATDAERVSKRA